MGEPTLVGNISSVLAAILVLLLPLLLLLQVLCLALDQSTAASRYLELSALRNSDKLGDGFAALVDAANTAAAAPATSPEAAAAAAGRIELDMLLDMSFVVADPRRPRHVFGVCTPEAYSAVVYYLSLPGRQMKKCPSSGVHGVRFVYGCCPSTAAAVGGSTRNESLLLLQPQVLLRRELSAAAGYTLAVWIYTPIPKTGALHALISGDAETHICISDEDGSVGALLLLLYNKRLTPHLQKPQKRQQQQLLLLLLLTMTSGLCALTASHVNCFLRV